MKTFKIACDWMCYGVYEIEAETLEEAIDIAQFQTYELPKNEEYIDSSFRVNYEVTEELNALLDK